MEAITLSKVWFKPSEVYRSGLWQCTATCNGQQYDMSELGSVTRRTARKYFKQRAADYFMHAVAK